MHYLNFYCYVVNCIICLHRIIISQVHSWIYAKRNHNQCRPIFGYTNEVASGNEKQNTRYVLSNTNSPSRLCKGCCMLRTQHSRCSRYYILNKSSMLHTVPTYHLVNYLIFDPLKITVQGHTFHLDEHVREVVKIWVNSVGGEIWFCPIFDLFPRWNKCVDHLGEYTEN